MNNNRIISKDYVEFLEDIKVRVMTVQRQTVRHINTELTLLYYHIGAEIIKAQRVKGWGAKIIEQLSCDLKSGFPNMKGFSAHNLKYMRRLVEEYERIEIGQQLVDQLPWGHVVTLLYQVTDKRDRFFYIEKNNVLAEYTLRDMSKPIGLAEYRLTEALPEEIKSNLPSIEELEAELAKNIRDGKESYQEGKDANS